MTAPSIPPGAKIRVVGDVHGDAAAFRYAIATDRFIVQLGDLADHGPDSAGTLRMMFDLVEHGSGLFILGNHDLKLARVLSGDHPRVEPVVQATVDQLDASLKARVLRLVAEAPAWTDPTAHWPAPCTGNRLDEPSLTAIPNEVCAGWTAYRTA